MQGCSQGMKACLVCVSKGAVVEAVEFSEVVDCLGRDACSQGLGSFSFGEDIKCF